jgi:hypothetical protein
MGGGWAAGVLVAWPVNMAMARSTIVEKDAATDAAVGRGAMAASTEPSAEGGGGAPLSPTTRFVGAIFVGLGVAVASTSIASAMRGRSSSCSIFLQDFRRLPANVSLALLEDSRYFGLECQILKISECDAFVCL